MQWLINVFYVTYDVTAYSILVLFVIRYIYRRYRSFDSYITW